METDIMTEWRRGFRTDDKGGTRVVVERVVSYDITQELDKIAALEQALVDVANRYIPTNQTIDIPILVNQAALRVAQRETERKLDRVLIRELWKRVPDGDTFMDHEVRVALDKALADRP